MAGVPPAAGVPPGRPARAGRRSRASSWAPSRRHWRRGTRTPWWRRPGHSPAATLNVWRKQLASWVSLAADNGARRGEPRLFPPPCRKNWRWARHGSDCGRLLPWYGQHRWRGRAQPNPQHQPVAHQRDEHEHERHCQCQRRARERGPCGGDGWRSRRCCVRRSSRWARWRAGGCSTWRRRRHGARPHRQALTRAQCSQRAPPRPHARDMAA